MGEHYTAIFLDLAKSKNYKIQKPSFHQKKNNIDYILEGQINGTPVSVSVDLKKKNKKDSNNWVYIEFQNSKGGKGWIDGLADFIVFETSNSFIWVPRKSLKNFLNSSSSVRWDLPFVDKPWLSKYRLFRRKNTLETITQVNIKDLMNIKNTKVWPKH